MNKAAAALLAIGLLQMAGDLLQRGADRLGFAALGAMGAGLKGIAAATNASPAPKVFSAVRGLETYSSRFFIEWIDREGTHHSRELTPETNARLRGPYNRRNVYGAVLAYGPVLVTDLRTRPMFDAVASYSLCGDAPLLRELGIQPEGIVGRVTIRIEPLPGTEMGDLPRVLEPTCP